jgi:hypothetical protein
LIVKVTWGAVLILLGSCTSNGSSDSESDSKDGESSRGSSSPDTEEDDSEENDTGKQKDEADAEQKAEPSVSAVNVDDDTSHKERCGDDAGACRYDNEVCLGGVCVIPPDGPCSPGIVLVRAVRTISWRTAKSVNTTQVVSPSLGVRC